MIVTALGNQLVQQLQPLSSRICKRGCTREIAAWSIETRNEPLLTGSPPMV